MSANPGIVLPVKPFLLANNWDRFGGRTSEILNAYYLSRRFGLDFRFTWPKEPRFPELDEMIGAFAPAFVEKFFIQEPTVENVEIKQLSIDAGLSPSEFIDHFEAANEELVAIKLSNFFSVPRFRGESLEESIKKFSMEVRDAWSEDALGAQSVIEKLYKDTYVIHARYGDLVTGSWKNYVEPSKYITGAQINSVIEICANQNKKLALISDSPEIVELFSPHKAEEDFLNSTLPNFEYENRQTLIDLFKMQFSAGVFAPSSSAYSKLGSHLGGREVISVPRRRISTKKDFEEFAKTQPFWKKLPHSTKDFFISRDMDQDINALGGIFNLVILERVTQVAYLADEKNPVSGNHLAIAKALLGQKANAKYLLESSMEISKGAAGIHEDPKYFAHLSHFVCVLIATLRSFKNPFRKNASILKSIMKLKGIHEELVSTQPFQIDASFANSTTSNIILFLEKISSMRFAEIRFLLISRTLGKITKEPFIYSEKDLFLLNLLQSIYLLMKSTSTAR
jgi:hypothetical protein